MKSKHLVALAVTVAMSQWAVDASAQSFDKVQSGSFGDMNWVAKSMLTGVTSTGNGSNPAGSSTYWPDLPAYNGAVHLLMQTSQGGFICSGTLLNDRRSILTAGHCVSGGAGTANPLSTTVYFQPAAGMAPGTRIQTSGNPNGGAVAVSVSDYFVHGSYTGKVIDQNDIAVLRLSEAAPSWVNSYGLYNGDLSSKDFTVTGYGRLGSGADGANNFSARLRTGENRYDFRLGDSIFNGAWSNILGEPAAQIEHSWISDFDSGLAANDASCRIAQASNVAGAAGAKFCNLGLGAREVGVAGGDSGGGSFINGLISSVNSYGLSFGTNWGDSLTGLNSSFGEFSGYVPVALHASWIQSKMVAAVPEPSTYAMMGLGLFGVAALARRRRKA